MMPYKAQVSNASRLGATRIAVPFERNRRVYTTTDVNIIDFLSEIRFSHCTLYSPAFKRIQSLHPQAFSSKVKSKPPSQYYMMKDDCIFSVH